MITLKTVENEILVYENEKLYNGMWKEYLIRDGKKYNGYSLGDINSDNLFMFKNDIKLIKLINSCSKFEGIENFKFYTNGTLSNLIDYDKLSFEDGIKIDGIRNNTKFEDGIASLLYWNQDESVFYIHGKKLTGFLYNSSEDFVYYRDGIKFTGNIEKYSQHKLIDTRYDVYRFISKMEYPIYPEGSFKDGIMIWGKQGKEFYHYDKPFTGNYKGKDYKEGYELTGIHNDIVYKNGIKFTGSLTFFELMELKLFNNVNLLNNFHNKYKFVYYGNVMKNLNDLITKQKHQYFYNYKHHYQDYFIEYINGIPKIEVKEEPKKEVKENKESNKQLFKRFERFVKWCKKI